LAESETPVSVPELSRRAEVTTPGTHQAVSRLVETGYVEAVGGGRSRNYALRTSDPMVQMLVELFAAELRRYESLLRSIRSVFDDTSPRPYSAWISSLPEAPGEPMEVSVVASAKSLTDSVRSLREALVDVEQQFDVTIELHPFTRADLPEIEAGDYVYITGIPLGDAARGERSAQTHQAKDGQSLHWSKRMARLVERDPSLVARARRHVERILESRTGPSRRDLVEWRDILGTYSAHRLCKLLDSETERATRLRQSSPFWAVLSQVERNWILGVDRFDDA
jgi:hypothetical protein